MNTEFLHRDIKVTISTLVMTSISFECTLDIKEQTPLAVAQRALDLAVKTFKACLGHVHLPTDREPGDEPMIQLELSYNESQSSFSVTELETVVAGNFAVAIDEATSKAFKCFSAKYQKFLEVGS